MQASQPKFSFWLFIQSLGGGNELLYYFLYHLVISAKYHRAFMASMLIAANFFIGNSLMLIYQEPLLYMLPTPVGVQEIIVLSCD